MTYLTGSVAAVADQNRRAYLDHVTAAWPLLHRNGASRLVETWGVDVPRGKVNDLFGAVDAQTGESVVFSWIEWPDRATADRAMQAIQGEEMPAMPFDAGRMIFGGFAPVFTAGSDRDAGYVQGFVLALPERNKAPYVTMAREAWDSMFRPKGCRGMVEAWGEDVPRGQKTDFYRATLAEPEEAVLFSWTAWPDRATCDAASRAMEAEMQGKDMPEMPFDGRRMMWGGFETLFDSNKANP